MPTPTQQLPEQHAHEDPAVALLKRAIDIVSGARRQSYGTPEDSFACIAALWSTWLNTRYKYHFYKPLELCAADVAALMGLLKHARLASQIDHADSWLDAAGYAACGARTTTQTSS